MARQYMVAPMSAASMDSIMVNETGTRTEMTGPAGVTVNETGTTGAVTAAAATQAMVMILS